MVFGFHWSISNASAKLVPSYLNARLAHLITNKPLPITSLPEQPFLYLSSNVEEQVYRLHHSHELKGCIQTRKSWYYTIDLGNVETCQDIAFRTTRIKFNYLGAATLYDQIFTPDTDCTLTALIVKPTKYIYQAFTFKTLKLQESRLFLNCFKCSI